MFSSELNQIIALEKGVKSRSYANLTEAHQQLQKAALLTGISRTYRPRDDEGERLPPESTRVQVRAEEVVKRSAAILGELFDVVATKDWANCTARADVVVDGKPLLSQVPVTYLLFLEKQLTDLHTFVSKLPVLDSAESWHFDPTQDCWASDPAETSKTKKVPRNHVKAEATEKHPAQVEVYHEDIVVGYWKTVKFSGAVPAARVRELTERVEKLQKAVKTAREEANGAPAEPAKTADRVFGFLFA
jgi:hypothetical protein